MSLHRTTAGGLRRQHGYPKMLLVPATYEHAQGIRCLSCGLTSYNANDIREKYCGNCHAFGSILDNAAYPP
jgi:hypothetical protein